MTSSDALRVSLLLLGPIETMAEAQTPRWTVDTVPLMRLAATADDGRPTFGSAAWAVRIGADEIALADGADRMIRIFGTDGKQRRALGREGRGPGEFLSVGWISTCGTDSLFAWDMISARLNVWHPTGGFVRSWTNTVVRGPMVALCSARREFAFPVRIRRTQESKPVLNTATTAGMRYRIWMDTFDLQILDDSGQAVWSIGGAVRGESISANPPSGGLVSLPRLLGLATHVAFTGELLAFAYTDSGFVRIVRPNGATEKQFRVGPFESTVSTEARDAALTSLQRRTPASAVELFGMVSRAIPVPARAPGYYDLKGSPDGALWFVVSPPGSRQTRLVAYRPDGSAVATLVIPVAIELFEVGMDHLLGRVESDDGEQEVRLYRFWRR